MKRTGKFILSCLLVFTPLYPSEITFKEASSEEISEIEQNSMYFYSEQLFEAGLCSNLDEAIEGAREELQESFDKQNKDLHYYQLLSKDSPIQYGYLVYSISEQEAFIEIIYLESPYRGQGLGKQILQELEIELKEKNIKAITLHVFDHNKAALTLYNRMGYVVTSTYPAENKPTGHYMEKNL